MVKKRSKGDPGLDELYPLQAEKGTEKTGNWLPSVLLAAIPVIGAIVIAIINIKQADVQARMELLPTISVLETRVAEPTHIPPTAQVISMPITQTPSIPTPVPNLIDSMDKLANWKISFCDDECGKEHGGSSSIFTSLVPGETTEAVEVLYDLKEAGWVVITKNVDYQTLAGTIGMGFSYKGSGAPSTIEFKLLVRYPDTTEDMIFGAYMPHRTSTENEWIHVDELYDQDIKCLSPADLCALYPSTLASLKYIQRIDFAISHKPGDTPGLGKVVFDNLVGIKP